MKKNTQGFTLIELLIVIAIMAILGAIIFVSLNPAERLQDARNARRMADVNSILAAIKLDQIDNGGTFYSDIASSTANTYYQIGEAETGCSSPCSNPPVILQDKCINLLPLIDEGYIADIPIDPNAEGVSSQKTGYYLYKFNTGQMTIGSCYEEKGTNSSIISAEVSR